MTDREGALPAVGASPAKLSPETKPRKLTERQKRSYVEQSFGARQACYELLHRVGDANARAAIVEQGRAAEESLVKYGGMIFGSLFADDVLPVPQDPEPLGEGTSSSPHSSKGR